jgi:hypothetical protein
MAKSFAKKGDKKKKERKERLSPEERDKLRVKRCPECFVNLPVEAKECHSCHTRLRGIDKFGRAKKRGKWISYVICGITWVIFFGYIKWAFF